MAQYFHTFSPNLYNANKLENIIDNSLKFKLIIKGFECKLTV